MLKYLGWVLAAADDNWPVVVGNLWKAQKSWALTARIMGWEVLRPQFSRMFFKAMVQAVLLFRLKTWVLTPCMGQSLRNFQHRVTRRITGRQPELQEDGGWEYPPLEKSM